MIRALAILACLATPASAQLVCADRGTVIARLAEKFGETRQSIGLANSGLIVEMWASAETGTWTFIATRPDGIACRIGSGTGFETISEATAPAGDAL